MIETISLMETIIREKIAQQIKNRIARYSPSDLSALKQVAVNSMKREHESLADFTNGLTDKDRHQTKNRVERYKMLLKIIDDSLVEETAKLIG